MRKVEFILRVLGLLVVVLSSYVVYQMVVSTELPNWIVLIVGMLLSPTILVSIGMAFGKYEYEEDVPKYDSD